MAEQTDNRTIAQRLHAVMVAVPSVEKNDRNEHQKFQFRGIDAVLNRIGPALRSEGVVVLPKVQKSEYTVEQFGSNRTAMGHVQVIVEYTFLGLLGDSVSVIAAGEATDSGDKATAKAMSVAYRTALLQTFCLPTDEPDPDSYTYERSAPEPVKVKPQVKVDDSVFDRLAALITLAADADMLEQARVQISDVASNSQKVLSEDHLGKLRQLFAQRRGQLA